MELQLPNFLPIISDSSMESQPPYFLPIISDSSIGTMKLHHTIFSLDHWWFFYKQYRSSIHNGTAVNLFSHDHLWLVHRQTGYAAHPIFSFLLVVFL